VQLAGFAYYVEELAQIHLVSPAGGGKLRGFDRGA
jgi:hypothetical protein